MEAPMTTSGNGIFSVLGTLGVALCCGLPLLLFAGITLYAALKHKQTIEQINSAIPTKISSLKPNNRLVRLEGVIKEVNNAIDGPPDSPLALVRLRVEVYERNEDGSGWRAAGDKLRATPFQLEDETGSVWINPQGLDKLSLGEGAVPATREVAEAAAILTGINPVVLNTQARAKLWELRGGQRVTVIGTIMQSDGKPVVGKFKKDPLIITSLQGDAVQVQTQQQVKTAWILTAILGIPGLLGLCCGLVAMAFYLIRMLQK
jgi:hypothetical protein